MSKKYHSSKRSLRRKTSIFSDLKGLERITKSSLEISLSMTSVIVEDLVQRLYREYPTETDQSIKLRAQKILCLGRRDIRSTVISKNF